MIRKFAAAVATGAVISAMLSSVALAAPGNPGQGAAACQPQQGQITAGVAQTGQLGTIITTYVTPPINTENQQSLFHCSQP